MKESQSDIAQLQALMDASLARSTKHLQSIITPGERTLTAAQLVQVLVGMCTLSIATVTASGEPRISGIDGHFIKGHWFFGTARGAAKARHLAVRPAVSVAHLRGEELGVFTHGTVEQLNPADAEPDPQWPEVLAHMAEHYGASPLEWGDDVVYYRLRPSWMVAYAFEPEKLLSKM
ncbi:pyridoxamine 5'-phosphate oxidase family protein [Allorhizocola rhizosphaerae]|uniref:pyridoxamine 5'-phosphate oxidase family protein n=1 Tax=Allorhizocola rhizosphaerae TaxID=1872709 RepID=UPI000E3B9B85|nr:pyridoxamine 5'-phosphate oxidase family protein [Allorhizocola rhizosphaerae]